MKVLVTGGTGYIGSHICVSLITAGMEPVVVDNLSTSTPEILDGIERITNFRPVFHEIDIRQTESISRILHDGQISAVIHLAGLKAVGESAEKPLEYYSNNVEGSLSLCEAMRTTGLKTIVFSSSATVYGPPDSVPLAENAPIRPTNPYGRTKALVEQLLNDIYEADPAWRIAILRYFNPAGAHESALIGEKPIGTPNNLMPYIMRVAGGYYPKLHVFGNDYPTPDGTGIRDYIHIMDLAEGHVAALRHLLRVSDPLTINLGTGRGYSVLELIRAFETASQRVIPYEIVSRRPGDVAACYADTSKAQRILGWKAQRGLQQICIDAWRWQCTSHSS